jgi:hypothetical protein
LQTYCLGAEIAISRLFHGLRALVVAQAETMEWIGRETSQAFDWILGVHFPKWSKQFVTGAALTGLVARLVSSAVAHLRPEITRTVRVVEHTVTRTLPQVAHAVAGGAIALPRWVIHLPARVGSIEGDVRGLGRRIRRLEKVIGAAAFAGLMANAIGGVTARCIRNGNIGRTARLLCGLDSGVLSTLLAGFAIVEGGFSIQELAREALAIEGDLIKGVKLLVSELEPL